MSTTASEIAVATPSIEELVLLLGEKAQALGKVNEDAARLQCEIAAIRQQLLNSTRNQTHYLLEGDAPGAVDKVDEQQEEVELISNSAIAFVVQVARKVYGDRFEGKSLPPIPSVEQVTAAFAHEKQQKEIAGRTEPTLRFVIVEDGDVLRYQPIILDGAQEMPLEAYENKDVYNMTREQRVLASRELNKNPDIRKELDHEDMTVYDLLSHGAAMQGRPIDQATWSMLTAKYKKGDRFVWNAVWRGVQSDRGMNLAGYVVRGDRLRFAVWGDVIF